jgi:hypothetical protein
MEIRLDFNSGSWSTVPGPITLLEVLMPAELPIACSLTATELPKRLADMADVGRVALLDVRDDGTQAELRFAAGAGVRDRVDAIRAAESQCCAFLDMAVTDEPDTVVLTIDASEGAEVVLTEIVDAFRGEAG